MYMMMVKSRLLVATPCILLLIPIVAPAEIHNVSVRDTFFSPNDLVIQPGDTVIWTDTESLGECDYDPCPTPPIHSVKADDNSFSSGPPADGWTFQRVFNQQGEVLYHCEAHSSPGQDINAYMNGRITVQEESVTGFEISPGLNDAWYNPATDGQGFLITVFPDIKQMFVAWFTYDTQRPSEGVGAILGEPGHRWLTAQGPYDGDTASLTLYLTQGGVFDAAEPAPEINLAGEGTLTIQFADCSEGLLAYEITSIGQSGEIPIQRIVSDNISTCEALATH